MIFKEKQEYLKIYHITTNDFAILASVIITFREIANRTEGWQAVRQPGQQAKRVTRQNCAELLRKWRGNNSVERGNYVEKKSERHREDTDTARV